MYRGTKLRVIADASLEVMQTRRTGVLKNKTVNLEFYTQKKHLKNEGETKSISDIQKLKESITHRHA